MMKPSPPDLKPQVLSMFRRGFDTAEIGNMLEIREATIERVLHAALAGDRMAEQMLRRAEMERQERRNAEEDKDHD